MSKQNGNSKYTKQKSQNFKEDLHVLFKNVDRIHADCISSLEGIYVGNSLSFEMTKSNIKGLSGDVCTKVLGQYLEEVCKVTPQYEVKFRNKLVGGTKERV
ncbi:MAG: hypothetical protein HZR80_05025 [Candidatus Heimdallarchaeota archaeon]